MVLKIDPRAETSSSESQTPVEVEEQSTPLTSVKRPKWFEQTLRDAREHVEPPRSTFRESRSPWKFLQYMALMTNITDSDPSSYEEATNQQVWKDAMVEENNSIMCNDFWEIVPRP